MQDGRISGPSRESGWASGLAALSMGLLIATTVTGLAILWLPFSITAQASVIVHTVVGLILVVPASLYVWRHWRAYRPAQLTHVKLTGYLAVALLALLGLSGIVLTLQALSLIHI